MADALRRVVFLVKTDEGLEFHAAVWAATNERAIEIINAHLAREDDVECGRYPGSASSEGLEYVRVTSTTYFEITEADIADVEEPGNAEDATSSTAEETDAGDEHTIGDDDEVGVIIDTGELAFATKRELLDQAAAALDRAYAADILGTVIYQGKDGEFYTMTTEAIIGIANPSFVVDTLNEILDPENGFDPEIVDRVRPLLALAEERAARYAEDTKGNALGSEGGTGK